METPDSDFKKEGWDEKFSRDLKNDIKQGVHKGVHENTSTGRVFGGLIIIIVGCIFLAKQMNVPMPEWIFSWPMILIAIGIYIGAKHSFRSGGWVVVILVGGVFMIEELVPSVAFHQYIWPVVIIAVGTLMVLRPKGKKNEWPWHTNTNIGSSQQNGYSDDYIDAVCVFGGNKKNIISKDFRGGDIVTFFGGMELDLSQADILKPTELEITAVFGGAKIVVPSNWRIKSELVTVFGGFEDKRVMSREMPETEKVLILRGTCVFGGIDVKSF